MLSPRSHAHSQAQTHLNSFPRNSDPPGGVEDPIQAKAETAKGHGEPRKAARAPGKKKQAGHSDSQERRRGKKKITPNHNYRGPFRAEDFSSGAKPALFGFAVWGVGGCPRSQCLWVSSTGACVTVPDGGFWGTREVSKRFWRRLFL